MRARISKCSRPRDSGANCGAHKGNDFRIVVDELSGDLSALESRLKCIAERGVPNYFGAQRFGRGARNLETATAWFVEGREPRDRTQRGFALSAVRAALFNEVLAARVGLGNWDRFIPGDVANLDGTGSIFAIETLDDALLQRCRDLDVHPTGPLWGSGELRSRGEAAELEREIEKEHAAFSNGLSGAGLTQERRALRMAVRNLTWILEPTRLILEFRLGRGSFATAVLTELIGATADVYGEDDDA